ncbi:dynein regulatory complex protein 8-like [Acipenser ruthenus]|uniref:dynein regulatory complex protein 8-like n=1 Tax=Acipenser ruthenus TaxID=7906 RepID=UPI00274208E6|nr:dynein regulatory complex protein 8-like [Acipenser ruthenus]
MGVVLSIEEEEPTGYIRFEKFLPTMTKVWMEQRIMELEANVLPHVFIYVDETGFNLSKVRRRGRNIIGHRATVNAPGQRGEPFTQEEMEEMLSAAIDPDKNVILYPVPASIDPG